MMQGFVRKLKQAKAARFHRDPSGNLSLVGPDGGGYITKAQSYTFATLPSAAAFSGGRIFVSDVGLRGSYWFSDGANFYPENGSVVLGTSGVPSGVAPTGSVAGNGALTLGTALNTTYDLGVFLYFPAGAVYAGSAAGSYWCVMSSTTLGTIYGDVLGTGWPSTSVPASPTAIVAAGPGAYTGSTSEITVATLTVRGGCMGDNGQIQMSIKDARINNANLKTVRTRFAGTNLGFANSATNASAITNVMTVTNAGSASRQFSVLGISDSLGGTVTAPTYDSVNTAVDFALTITEQLAVATDYVVINTANITLNRS